MSKYQVPINCDGQAPAFAWPGGYPIFYLMGDGETMCPKCVTANLDQIQRADEFSDRGWEVVADDANYEDPSMLCCHCGGRIPSAYAEDRAEVIAGTARLEKGFMTPSIHHFAMNPDFDACGDDANDECAPGFYARLSASGYLDCTDWSGPFDTVEDAEAYLVETYDDGESEVL